MAIEPQLMVQCVGAVVVYFAARMCHSAFVASIDVWYSSPANRHGYFKAFKDRQLGEDMMIPKALLSLSDYETDVENLGVVANELGVPDSEADMALDITNLMSADQRCSFLRVGASFTSQLRDQGKLTDFYQAAVIAEIGMQIESSAKALAKLTDSDYESASDPESDPDAPLPLGRSLHRFAQLRSG
eukprot:Skav205162  [mRNA]  locus=scaffold2749:41534:45947:+ [translate_table: standard]